MRILVVEDDALIALSIEDILTEAGHTVVGLAPTKLRALTLAQQIHPDLALIDLRLADGMTGADIARELSLSNVSTIVISALPPDMVAAGRTISFIAKPFLSETLLDAIAALGPSVTHSEAA